MKKLVSILTSVVILITVLTLTTNAAATQTYYTQSRNNGSGDSISPRSTDAVPSQKIKISFPFNGIKLGMLTFGNAGNSTAVFTLYKWNTDYDKTVAGNPINTQTITFKDNETVLASFSQQAAGEYLWTLTDGQPSGKAGIWANAIHDGESLPNQTSFENGAEFSITGFDGVNYQNAAFRVEVVGDDNPATNDNPATDDSSADIITLYLLIVVSISSVFICKKQLKNVYSKIQD